MRGVGRERVDVEHPARRMRRDRRGRAQVAEQRRDAPRRGVRQRQPHEAPRERVAGVGREGGEHADDGAAGLRDAAHLPARGVPAARVERAQQPPRALGPAGVRGVVGRRRRVEEPVRRIVGTGGAHDDVHCRHDACVSRFAEPQHPIFRQLNASIGFDWRLGPYDVEQSRAHATMLAAAGSSATPTATRCSAGLERVEEELDGGAFAFREDDEDIHMAIERRLTEIVGPVGGKLHTARSRNDQVATDMAMFTRAHALQTLEKLQHLQSALVQLAERHEDWAMPGYTHLQRAQPVYLSHHLLAYFWMFRRDARRFEFVLGSTSELPLGAGALAGVNFATDRGLVARELGFAGRGAELDRRRLEPRLRARLPRRGGDVRDAPLAARRRARALVLAGVRLLPALRRVGVRLLDHAAEEEPRRRGAAARQGAARRRPAGRAARRAARPPADLQQGHAGGQGAPVRRGRHARPVPAGGGGDARGRSRSTATGSPRRPPTR